MTFILAAIVPHPPLLRETIGKENRNKLSSTIESLKAIEQDMYALNTETLLVISPHGKQSEHFFLNINGSYTPDFSEFGDYTPTRTFLGDLEVANDLRKISDEQMPLNISTEKHIDYGFAIPLLEITQHMSNIRVLPMSTSIDNLEKHFLLGKKVREVISNTNRRIAVIASADLSHRLNKESPGGFSPAGMQFDQKIIELISKKKFEKIISLPDELISKAGECGLRPICILAGILSDVNIRVKVLSYESPFGIGYLTTEINV